MKRSLALVLAAVTSYALAPVSRGADKIDVTDCYSGTAVSFHTGKSVTPVYSWSQNGILTSHGQDKRLNNAVEHCEGVQRGAGPQRKGYGLCKIVDADGDMIVAEIPYSGLIYKVKFIEGSGKWKGMKGSLRSILTVRSKAGMGAMPGTYQGCRRETGSVELPR